MPARRVSGRRATRNVDELAQGDHEHDGETAREATDAPSRRIRGSRSNPTDTSSIQDRHDTPPTTTDTASSQLSYVQNLALSYGSTTASTTSRSQATRNVPRPRAVTRRSKQQRDALDLAEQERADASSAAAQRAQAPPTGPSSHHAGQQQSRDDRSQQGRQGWGVGLQGRGQGRGGYMGVQRQGTGAFSLGSFVKSKPTPVARAAGEGGGGSARTRSGAEIKVEGQSKAKAAKPPRPGPTAKAGAGRDVRMKNAQAGIDVGSSAEEEDDDDDDDDFDDDLDDFITFASDDERKLLKAKKRDVDFIDLASGSEDEDGGVRNVQRLFPVRVPQREHVEHSYNVPLRPTAEGEDGGEEDGGEVEAAGVYDKSNTSRHRHRDVEITESRRPWRGVFDEEEDEGSGPTIKTEQVEDAVMVDVLDGQEIEGEAGPAPRQTESKRRKASAGVAKTRPVPPLFNSPAEELEYKILQGERRIIVEELGHVDPTDENEGVADARGSKAGALYLFQFPPILPDLERARDGVKKEDDEDEGAGVGIEEDGDVVVQSELVDLTKSKSDKGKARAVDPASGGGVDGGVKVEVKQEIKADPDVVADADLDVGPTVVAPGRVGKMRVHKSGRVSFDWGQLPMRVGLGTQASFYEDAVLVEMGYGEREGRGEVWGMGPVKGKFVVAPDWERLMMG